MSLGKGSGNRGKRTRVIVIYRGKNRRCREGLIRILYFFPRGKKKRKKGNSDPKGRGNIGCARGTGRPPPQESLSIPAFRHEKKGTNEGKLRRGGRETGRCLRERKKVP